MTLLHLTVEQLLQRFPNGFAISPSGELFQVVAARKESSSLPYVEHGGYLSVVIPVVQPGDEYYGQSNGEFHNMTAGEMAEWMDKLIKMADTIEEDGILAKLYTTYSQKLNAAAKMLEGK